jgi:hypothetical protein
VIINDGEPGLPPSLTPVAFLRAQASCVSSVAVGPLKDNPTKQKNVFLKNYSRAHANCGRSCSGRGDDEWQAEQHCTVLRPLVIGH